MNKLLYIFLFASLFFVACSSEDVPDNPQNNDKQIELRLDIKNFVGETKTKAGFNATAAEEQIDNINLFIESQVSGWHQYYIAGTTFTGGTWGQQGNKEKILLSLTPSDVGSATVYVVANAGNTLSNVSSASDLKSKLVSTATSWTNLGTPIIMSGQTDIPHNFTNNSVLDAVTLTRAVAKAEVTVTLSQQYQSEIAAEYAYRLLNFNKNTYLFEDATPKAEDLEGTGTNWQGIDNIVEFVKNGNTVTGFTFTTYLNERDNATAGHTTLELKLPFWDNGAPPPQFLEESLPVQFPAKIKRNHYYKVAVQM